MKLSYLSYKRAVDEAFRRGGGIRNPTIFWNKTKGFYVGWPTNQVPNSDFCLGEAYYNLNQGDAPSFRGTRAEYEPIGRGIRKYMLASDKEHIECYMKPATFVCEGYLQTGEPCPKMNYGDVCERCGHQNRMVDAVWERTITDYIREFKTRTSNNMD